jgi:hypothetical protein
VAHLVRVVEPADSIGHNCPHAGVDVAALERGWAVRLPVVRVVLVLIVVPALIFINGAVWYTRIPRAATGELADFGTFYAAGAMVHSGHTAQLYDHAEQEHLQESLVPFHRAADFIHPAYEAWFFAPLSLLSFRTAYFVFMAINGALLVVAFLLLSRRGDMGTSSILILGFAPISFALLNGQDSIVMFFFLSLAAWLLERDMDMAAGMAVALGLFRFQLVLPIALLFVIWRRWKFTVGFASMGSAALSISLFMAGWSGTSDYLHLLTTTAHTRMPEFMVSIRALVMTVSLRNLSIAIVAIASVLFFWWRSRNSPRSGREALEWAIPAALLVGYHVYLYDASIAAISMLPMMTAKDQSWRPWTFIVAAGLGFFSRDWVFLAVIPLFFLAYGQRAAISSAPTDRSPAWAWLPWKKPAAPSS